MSADALCSVDRLKTLASCYSVDAFLDRLRACLETVSDQCTRLVLVALGVYEAGFMALGVSPEEFAKMLREVASRGSCSEDVEAAITYFVGSIGLRRAVELLGEDLVFGIKSDDLWLALRPWLHLDPDGVLSIVSRASYGFLRGFLDWLADDVAWTGRFRTLAELAGRLDLGRDGDVVDYVVDSVAQVLVVLGRVEDVEEFVEDWLHLDPVAALSHAISFASTHGYTSEVMELFERFVLRGGDVREVVRLVASGLCREGAIDELARLIDRVSRLAPECAWEVARKVPFCYLLHDRLEDAMRYARQLGDDVVEVAVKLHAVSREKTARGLPPRLEEEVASVLRKLASMLQEPIVVPEYIHYIGLVVESLARLGYVDEVLRLAELGETNKSWILRDVINGLVEGGNLKRALEIVERYWNDLVLPLEDLATIAARAIEAGDEKLVREALSLAEDRGEVDELITSVLHELAARGNVAIVMRLLERVECASDRLAILAQLAKTLAEEERIEEARQALEKLIETITRSTTSTLYACHTSLEGLLQTLAKKSLYEEAARLLTATASTNTPIAAMISRPAIAAVARRAKNIEELAATIKRTGAPPELVKAVTETLAMVRARSKPLHSLEDLVKSATAPP